MENNTIQLWNEHIDSNTRLVKDLFGALDSDALNRKPAPERWSIAQNLDHIMTINQTYNPIFEDVLAGTLKLPFIARFSPLVRWMGKMILKSVDPARRKKIKTFPIWEPSQNPLPSDIFYRFVAHQEQLKATILSLKDPIEKGVVIHSPANRYILYPLATAIDIIITHELRHIHQAQELLQG